jgi:acetyl esterase/lipase
MDAATQGLTTEDIEYIRHDDRPFLLRLTRPQGSGPFPFVVDIHGGAWNNSDRLSCKMRNEMWAQAGIAGAALDFRHGPDGYPTSLADINYAIRWLKAHAHDLRLDPARVGLTGASSGGHLAVLAAMRPDDQRYSAIKLDGFDAKVRSVGVIGPVINPLSRYRRAVQAKQGSNPPEWAIHIPDRHETYWKTEAAMSEGSPVLALERGEEFDLLPAFIVQGTPDVAHIYRDPDAGGGAADANEPERFVRLYKARGGDISLVYVESQELQSPQLEAPLTAFFSKHLKP